MGGSDPVKIIITDDHWLFRSGVRASLEKKEDILVIGEAEHGQDLLEKLVYLKPDIILLDISMPVMDGFKTLSLLRIMYPGIKVIILSMHNDPGIIRRMLELGASSYLTKAAGSENIYETIMACRNKWFHISETIQKAIRSLPPIRDMHKKYLNDHELNSKEIEILKYLDEDFTSEEIGTIIDLSTRTVQAIIEKLKKKAGVRSNAKLLLICKQEKIFED